MLLGGNKVVFVCGCPPADLIQDPTLQSGVARCCIGCLRNALVIPVAVVSAPFDLTRHVAVVVVFIFPRKLHRSTAVLLRDVTRLGDVLRVRHVPRIAPSSLEQLVGFPRVLLVIEDFSIRILRLDSERLSLQTFCFRSCVEFVGSHERGNGMVADLAFLRRAEAAELLFLTIVVPVVVRHFSTIDAARAVLDNESTQDGGGIGHPLGPRPRIPIADVFLGRGGVVESDGPPDAVRGRLEQVGLLFRTQVEVLPHPPRIDVAVLRVVPEDVGRAVPVHVGGLHRGVPDARGHAVDLKWALKTVAAAVEPIHHPGAAFRHVDNVRQAVAVEVREDEAGPGSGEARLVVRF